MMSTDQPVKTASSRITPDRFRAVTTRSTVKNVVDQIVDCLRDGTLEEGEFLPSERTLAEVMFVSRRTIREAVRLLAGAGVVDVLPGSAGGIRITSIWVPDELGSSPSTVLAADQMFAVLEARRTLEPRVAQLAGARGTDEDFKAMERTIKLQWDHRDDRRKVSQLNAQFHRTMWRAARNETLEAAMKVIFRQLELGLDMSVRTPHDTTESIEIHERTIEALMRGDADDISAAMDEHMSYLETISESVLGRRRIRTIPDFLQPRQRWEPDLSTSPDDP
jgi:DNA-binding FadR family transcriptional regulator